MKKPMNIFTFYIIISVVQPIQETVKYIKYITIISSWDTIHKQVKSRTQTFHPVHVALPCQKKISIPAFYFIGVRSTVEVKFVKIATDSRGNYEHRLANNWYPQNK